MLKSKSFLAVDFGAGSLKLAEFEVNEAGGLRLKQYGLKSLGAEGAQETTREATVQKALLDMIAEKEGIAVTEEEIKSRIAVLARHFQTTPENVINLFITKDGSLENFKHTIQDEKVMDLLLAKADVVKGV